MNFDIIERAGITQQEFGELFDPPVQRVTVNNWCTGRSSPHPRLKAQVKTALEKLERAVDAGQLPLNLSAIKSAAREYGQNRRRDGIEAALQ